ncbi:heavy metal translocating P-type ATPase [Thermospira aquatica]|uniref:Copper-translocating P-type ATPase n=1 Tax=Thermospira aquatica TaxID=2828656 RepID=A0AAX3BG07_9SPIR|nr:heavy metal translocating P-type ATPase [Thermospira aquatica]URA11267.1 copper-translocating P-type ATPase [Thermospira aquatica]
MQNIKLKIEGMSCTSCALNIEKALKKSDIILEAKVDFASKEAEIFLKDEKDIEKAIDIVKQTGYNAYPKEEKEIIFNVEGMSCTSCEKRVEKALRKIDGVTDVWVSLSTKQAKVRYEGDIPLKTFYKVVKEVGYELREIEEVDKELIYLKKEKIRLILVWLFTLPIAIKMILSMVFHIEIIPEMIGMYLDLVISGIVIFIIGFPVIRSTFFAFKSLSFNMDSLIGIGTIASFSTGVLKIFGLQIEDFSVIGAMIMAINQIGNYLKQLSTGKASEAIKKLIQLGAKEAHLVTENGIIDIPVNELKISDVMFQGFSTVDESIATGESIPVDRKEGDKVIGATINQSGVIKVKIEKVGSETFLAQVIKMVEEAQRSKVPIQELADKITSYFVPGILLLSLATFLFWFFFPEIGERFLMLVKPVFPWLMIGSDQLSMALFSGIATLVIACPCALGLATPTALMVGMGMGATNGILIRKGEAIEKMKNVNTIVFDKTGTITKGKPLVTDYFAIDKDKLFNYGLALESLSEHPLAKAIVEFIPTKSELKVENFSALAGKGVSGIINGKKVVAGKISFLEEKKVNISFQDREKLIKFANEGKTIVGVAEEDILLGAFAISDDLKIDSIEAIRKLHALGLKIVMLTGDNKLSAEYIAKSVGIDEVYSELLPEDKIEIVKKLQKDGKIVAMVGDGINDAPSLKQADVGIAIGTGTDIAIESSDITLVSGSLMGVYKAFLISTKTFGKIRQNLFWAFFYNIIAIPLAMSGILHPIVAELAMAFSSINVVVNSLTLKRIKI